MSKVEPMKNKPVHIHSESYERNLYNKKSKKKLDKKRKFQRQCKNQERDQY